MERFSNKVAVVTGSSSGIGAAICRELVKYGIIVVGVARRIEKLQKLAEELNEPGKSAKFYPLKCDVTVESEIAKSFEWITSNVGAIAILINNAGITILSLLSDVTGEDITQIFDTNVKASILCSKIAVQSMIKNSIRGHIINMNSITGHSLMSAPVPNTSRIYTASKHAQRVFSEALRRELVYKKADIKVTNISPGLVTSEMSKICIASIDSWPAEGSLQPKDIADACMYVLGTPFNVLVSELTIMPIRQHV